MVYGLPSSFDWHGVESGLLGGSGMLCTGILANIDLSTSPLQLGAVNNDDDFLETLLQNRTECPTFITILATVRLAVDEQPEAKIPLATPNLTMVRAFFSTDLSPPAGFAEAWSNCASFPFTFSITTLEGQISDRDKPISAIRDELGIQKLENAELRQEIDNLKKAMLEGRAPLLTGLPPPSSTTDISVGSKPAVTRRSAPLAKANPNKDVRGNESFWGGQVGMGGVTSVHATMIPDLAFPQPLPPARSLPSSAKMHALRLDSPRYRVSGYPSWSR